MKKTAIIFTISLIFVAAIMFSCGNGGGVDEAINESFTITYNANGAESGTVPPSQRGSVSSPPPIQGNIGNLAKNGYILNATSPWNSKADGSGAIYTPGRGYTPENLTLYAQWIPLFNYQVISPVSPSPAMDGAQKSSANAYIKITGLTYEGRQLSDIVIPESIDGYTVVSIGANAFQDCGNIADISIPENVTTIEDNAFAGCTGITTLIIPRSVTSIGSGTFSGCGGLNSIVLLSTTPPAMGASAMEGCTATVSVPVAAVDTYKATEGWNTYSASIAGYSTEIYIVTYDGQGATTQANPSGKEIVPPAVTVGQLPTAPIKTGYNFGGWFTEIEGGGSSFTASTVVSSNITVYAKWDEYNYTVTFNDQGATTPVGETSKIVSSPSTTVDSIPTEPSKGGFYFGGWNTKPDGTGTVFNANTTVSSDITIYAVWLNNPTFTVTFDGQGATTAANPSSKQVISPATTVGELPAPPLKTGYIFGGWYNQPEGAGGEFSASTVVTKNTTVYAKWNSYSYTVTFNDQGATTPVGDASKTVTSPNTTVGTLPTEPVNTGYYFGGWNTKSDGSGAAFNADTQVTGDITVYAMWMNNPTFTVTFNGQGATTQANPSTKQVVSPAVTVGELPDPPLKTGYVFGRWYTGQNGTGSLFTTSTIVNSNVVVYAKWDSYSYTVTFNDQGATTAANPTSKPVNSPAVTVGSLPTPPLKIGYNFGGWYNEPGGTDGEFTASTVVTADRTVYAKWNSYTYTVTFDSQGATTDANPTSKSVASPNTTINALPTPPEKDGFIFDGWYTQPGGAGNEFTAGTIISNNITVYAKWIALFTYDIGNEIIITGLTTEGKKLSSIVIPSSIDGKPVISIGSIAFNGCTGLTSVTIPDNVASIGRSAFNGCNGLTSITIPNSVTSIGENTFNGCTRLTSITIPNSVTSIEKNTFNGCTGLTSITIPNSVTSIGETAFYGCTKLTRITIPTSVTSIGINAFKNCRITTVNYNATNCSSMGYNVNNPAFSGCRISTVKIGDNVKRIPSYAFYDCNGLTGITIPDSVTSIGEYAFGGCTGLTNITIPDSVTSIGENAFAYCTGLISATLGNSITSVGNYAFKNCSNLATIYFNAENCKQMSRSADKPVFDGCSKISTIILGNNVGTIPVRAFKGCTGLTNITIPDSVTSIGASALGGCTSLTNITIPDSVTSIGASALSGCTSLTSITIPDSVISIEQYAFTSCSGLTDITIPSGVTYIGDYAFGGCSSLTSITIPDSVTSVGEKLFDGCTNLKSITIPQAVVDNSDALKFLSYSNADMGTNVSVTLSNNVTSIGAKTFFEYHGLVNITIPESVISIGVGAFYRTNLRNVTIPSGITKINASTFWDCSPLTEVTFKGTIPPTYDITSYNNVQYPANNPFENCSNLTTIKVPAESVEAYKTASYWCHYAAMIVADE